MKIELYRRKRVHEKYCW